MTSKYAAWIVPPRSNGDTTDWDHAKRVSVAKPPKPDWKYGSGVNSGDVQKKHIEIDPFEDGRPVGYNYTLIVSGIVPRPIGLLSTVSRDGASRNLAPFSYFQAVSHDPPIFVVGFASRHFDPDSGPKDSLHNLEETGECTINIVSEHFIEAVVATAINAPYGVSEWDISGLHPAPSTTVAAPHVQESIFSIETKLLKIVEYDATKPSAGPPGRLAIIEATRFWVREDAIDEQRRHIDLQTLRPVGQLGGFAYTRVVDTFDVPNTTWQLARLAPDPVLDKLAPAGR